MQKQNGTVSQKVKDKIFYFALIVGVIAIFAVVAVYTMGQNGGTLAQDDNDVKRLSEYAYGDREEKSESKTVSTEADVTKGDTSEHGSKPYYGVVDIEEESAVAAANEDLAVNDTSEVEKSKDETVEANFMDNTSVAEEKMSVPVVADAGELNFNSESTIAWPVTGSVLLPFSMETTVYFKTLDQYRCNPGMLIAAGAGTTVKSAYLGKVTKVTSDNTYGNMVTMYLGNDYSVTYAQLDTIYVKEGDFVKEGESIGTIGQPTDAFADEGSHLFFEMLQGEKPVDPVLFME